MKRGQARAELPGAWWTSGTSLAERIARPEDCATSESESAITRWRLDQWQERHELRQSGQFERRLAATGLTLDRLRDLLEEEPDALESRLARPTWADQVAVALADADRSDDIEGLAVTLTPFARPALRRIRDELAGLTPGCDVDALLACWSERLHGALRDLAARTLVLELNVLRVSGRLLGDTPQERYADFVRRFRRPEALAALCGEYTVLARLLVQESEQFATGQVEMVRRFAADRDSIVESLLAGVDPGPLAAVSLGGDNHQGGRSVAVLTFANGAKIVYKPRPLGVHRCFNDVLGWLNERVPELGLIRLGVISRDGYGWVEFAEHLPCAAAGDVDQYYHRLGALLAVLYALDGADFHCENLIACADQPVLVDLEALFHPAFEPSLPEYRGDPALAAAESSVGRSALLPVLMVGDGGVIDMSGLGGDKDVMVPMKAATYADAGTDIMRLVREHPVFTGRENRPHVAGDDVVPEPADHLPALLAGFARAYDVIAAHPEELVTLMRTFADEEVRVVMRATQTYVTLLSESTHPDHLRHGLDRDRVLDYLWALSRDDETLERLIEHEMGDLWRNDVPIFMTRPGSRDVWSADGSRLAGLLAEPPLERAIRKVRAMGEQDRVRQEWFIRASMISRDLSGMSAFIGTASLHDEPATPATPEELTSAAVMVADLVAEQAWLGPGRANWLGLEMLDDKYWAPRPLGWELYGGYVGVALFLARIAVTTGEQRYADLARSAVAPMRHVVGKAADLPLMGAYSGLAGSVYGMVHLAALLDDPELAASAELVAELCATAAETDSMLDLIGGSAGTLAAMLAVHETTRLAAAWKAAQACAERLVSTASAMPEGFAWRTEMPSAQPLAGFSHGAAGIGWALLRYADAAGDESCRRVALGAFAYEHGLYSAEQRNWPDFRDGAGGERALHAWCHGAPGVGLSRLALGSDPDLTRAVAAELAHGPMTNHSLCHGELGNLELLLHLRERPEVAQALTARGAGLLRDLRTHGPRCGTPGDTGTPGLMNGLAGIGYGLLRLAAPGEVPSVLLLEAPAARVS
ncbi:type 2 lanthipeptide synthetase LanM family protein [Nonomuraea soli]|uniref:Type 2 lantibiotic biosynthesis protein LanM n=1 Tax=Nonomuraea soli TaxID=1032476 RepID=A0A7W0CNG4_9ACTN|nr:type 2 lanthipeptide synthetase LanM family protein [Nonomuraea soli]MBA2894318.1 type 2 lantibiotic biosynthesis protein LanM [Nonomuraea soli]